MASPLIVAIVSVVPFAVVFFGGMWIGFSMGKHKGFKQGLAEGKRP